MKDLYQIDKDHPWLGRHAYDKATLERFLHHGLLIPVTIDYEAAATQLQSAEIDPHGTWLGWAKIIVDAAVKGET